MGGKRFPKRVWDDGKCFPMYLNIQKLKPMEKIVNRSRIQVHILNPKGSSGGEVEVRFDSVSLGFFMVMSFFLERAPSNAKILS